MNRWLFLPLIYQLLLPSASAELVFEWEDRMQQSCPLMASDARGGWVGILKQDSPERRLSLARWSSDGRRMAMHDLPIDSSMWNFSAADPSLKIGTGTDGSTYVAYVSLKGNNELGMLKVAVSGDVEWHSRYLLGRIGASVSREFSDASSPLLIDGLDRVYFFGRNVVVRFESNGTISDSNAVRFGGFQRPFGTAVSSGLDSSGRPWFVALNPDPSTSSTAHQLEHVALPDSLDLSKSEVKRFTMGDETIRTIETVPPGFFLPHACGWYWLRKAPEGEWSLFHWSLNGTLSWKSPLSAGSFSALKLDAHGSAFVLSDTGYVSKLSASGSLEWVVPVMDTLGKARSFDSAATTLVPDDKGGASIILEIGLEYSRRNVPQARGFGVLQLGPDGRAIGVHIESMPEGDHESRFSLHSSIEGILFQIDSIPLGTRLAKIGYASNQYRGGDAFATETTRAAMWSFEKEDTAGRLTQLTQRVAIPDEANGPASGNLQGFQTEDAWSWIWSNRTARDMASWLRVDSTRYLRVVVEPETLILRPKPGFGKSVIVWTAPRDGEYLIAGQFRVQRFDEAAGNSRRLMPVAVRINGETISQLNSTDEPVTYWPFRLPRVLKSGDRIEFTAAHSGLDAPESPLEVAGLQVAISKLNSIPYIEFPGSPTVLTVEAGKEAPVGFRVIDPDGDPVAIRAWLDGQPISVSRIKDGVIELPKLAVGFHELNFELTDLSGKTSSTPVYKIVAQGASDDSVVIPRDKLAEIVHASAFADAVATLGESPSQIGTQLLMPLTVRWKERLGSDLTAEQLETILGSILHQLQELDEPPDVGPMGKHSFRSGASKTGNVAAEGDAFRSKSFWRTFFSTALCSVAPSGWIPPARATCVIVVKETANFLEELGAKGVDHWAEQDTKRILAETDRKVAELAQRTPEVRAVVDRTVGKAIGIRREETVESHLAKTHRMSPDLKSKLLTSRNAAGDLVTTKQELLGLAKMEFSGMRTNIAALMDSNERLLRQQDAILTTLQTQQLEADFQESVQAEQREREANRQDRHAAVATVAELIGYADPAAGKQVAAVGGNLLKIHDTLRDLAKATQAGGLFSLKSLAMTGDVVGAVFGIITSLFSESGPTPEQLILDEIGNLKQLVRDLGDQMNVRFDRIEEKLDNIVLKFSDRFDRIDFRIGVVQQDLFALETHLVDLRSSIDRVDGRMQDLFRAQEQRYYEGLRIELENYEAGLLPDAQTAFPRLSGKFFQIATLDSIDPISAPRGERSFRDADISTELSANSDRLTGDLNYLNQLIRERGWMGLDSLSVGLIPAAPEWLLGAEGLTRMHRRWPLLGRSDPLHLSRLDAVVATGEVLATALERVTLLRQGVTWRTNELWTRVISDYRAKAQNVITEIRRLEDDFESRAIANGDSNREQAVASFDLWMPLERMFGYVPRAFDSLALPTFAENQAVRELSRPDQASQLFADLPVPIHLAEFLSLFTNLNASIRNVEIIPTRTKITISYNNDYRHHHYENAKQERVEVRSQYLENSLGFFDGLGYQRDPNIVYIVWQRGYQEEYYATLKLSLAIEDASGDIAVFTYKDDVEFLEKRVAGRRLYRTSKSKEPEDRDDFYDRQMEEVKADRDPPDLVFPGYPTNPSAAVDPSEMIKRVWNGERGLQGEALPNVRARFSAGATRALVRPVIPLQESIRLALRSQQQKFYLDMSHKIAAGVGTESQALGRAARELDGSWALLHSFVRLGLPETYQESDVLRSLLVGTASLPNAEVLIGFANLGVARAQSSITHTQRIELELVLTERLNTFERFVGARLAEIQDSGQTEILKDVRVQLEDLKRIRLNQHHPAPPVLFSSPNTPGKFGVRVYGESFVPYRLEMSPDLHFWTELTEPLQDGGTVSLDMGQTRVLFLRVKELSQ